MRLQLLVLVAASFAMVNPAIAEEIVTESDSQESLTSELLIANQTSAADLGTEINADQTVFNNNPDQPDFNSKNNPEISQGFGSLYTRTSAWYVGGSLGPVFPGNITFDGSKAWRDYGDFVNDPGLVPGTYEVVKDNPTTQEKEAFAPEGYVRVDDVTLFDTNGTRSTLHYGVPLLIETDASGNPFRDQFGNPIVVRDQFGNLVFPRTYPLNSLDHDGDGTPSFQVDESLRFQETDKDWDGDGVPNDKDSIIGNQFTNKEIEDVLSTGFGGSIFAGYEFNKRWAIDLEVALQGGGLTDEGKKDFNSQLEFKARAVGKQIDEDKEGTQNYFVSAITINPRFTIPLGETETKPAKWSIFISPGVGIGTYSWKQGVITQAGTNQTTGEPIFGDIVDYNLSKTNVAFQVKAGAAYRFNYGFEIFGQVRYLVIPDVVQYVKDDLSLDSKTYSAFSPEFGLRFRF